MNQCCIIVNWTLSNKLQSNCIQNLNIFTIIGSDNGLLPCQCQAIIWTNAGMLLIRPLATNFCEISIEIHIFPLKKSIWKCRKWRQFCLGLNVLSASVWMGPELGYHNAKPSAGPMLINSLWPSDAIWHWRSWSTPIQVMACCLMAPSHHVNQCWVTTNKILYNSFQGNIYLNTQDINPQILFEIYTFWITATSTREQW